MPEALFWISALGILYTYTGYPLLLFLRGRIFPHRVKKGEHLPSVSLLLAAHNEAQVIRQKIQQCLTLDYPKEKLEILVGTDGCTDATDEVLAGISSDQLRKIRFAQRVGKPTVLNHLASLSGGEILVFVDARQRLHPQAVRRLAENFRDPAVGAVGGELKLLPQEGASATQGLGLYWRYETWIRKMESAVGSTLGASGALWALRRKLYRPLHPQTILDDLALPLAVVEQGYRVAFEPNALAFDWITSRADEEFKRKVRTLAGNYPLFFRYARLLTPPSPIAWQFWSHKVFRTFVPFWMLTAWAASAALPGTVYTTLWALQTLFYALALLGWMEAFGRIPRAAYLFCLLHVSAVMGLVRFLIGGQPVTWEKAHA